MVPPNWYDEFSKLVSKTLDRLANLYYTTIHKASTNRDTKGNGKMTAKDKISIKEYKKWFKGHGFTDNQFLAIINSEYRICGYAPAKNEYTIYSKNNGRKQQASKEEILSLVI